MTIGENIKKLREAKGWSQQRLADELDMSRPTITQFERGTRNFSVQLGRLIAKALDCTLNDLIDEGPGPSQSGEKETG